MDSAIRLRIEPFENGFKVVVRSLSQEAIPVLVARGLQVPDDLKDSPKLYVFGERLKVTATLKAAEEYKARFYALSLADQLYKIGTKTFKVVRKEDKVVVTVQYYKVMHGVKQVASTYDLRELAKYRRHPDYYWIEKSIAKQKVVSKADYNKWKENGWFEEVTKQAEGIKGMLRNVKDITKMRVRGADRHQGFRMTTSPSFYKSK